MGLKGLKAKEQKILKNFRLKESTINKLIHLANEHDTDMTSIIEYLINHSYKDSIIDEEEIS